MADLDPHTTRSRHRRKGAVRPRRLASTAVKDILQSAKRLLNPQTSKLARTRIPIILSIAGGNRPIRMRTPLTPGTAVKARFVQARVDQREHIMTGGDT